MAIVYRAAEADVLVVGASARAAAASCLRAGLRPLAIDLFGDLDLRTICPAIRLHEGLEAVSLGALLEELEPRLLLAVGGMENRPELLARVARRHTLLGPSAAAIRAIRDRARLAAVFRESGLASPRVRSDPPEPRRGQDWLFKPTNSGGGVGIQPASESLPAAAEGDFQELVEGRPLSAVCVASPTGTELLGCTRQLLGGGPSAPPFAYAGSIGPIALATERREQLESAAQRIAETLELRGLFGIDLVEDADGTLHAIELNPRYTSSVEVLEAATGVSSIRRHARAVLGRSPVETGRRARALREDWPPPGERRYSGKAIVYARGALRITDRLKPPSSAWLADLPAPGERIPAGSPVLTLRTIGGSIEDCEVRLRHAAEELAKELYCRPPGWGILRAF